MVFYISWVMNRYKLIQYSLTTKIAHLKTNFSLVSCPVRELVVVWDPRPQQTQVSLDLHHPRLFQRPWLTSLNQLFILSQSPLEHNHLLAERDLR